MSKQRPHQSRPHRLATGVGAAVVASALPLLSASPAAAAAAAKPWDFDGDGKRDLAVGVSGENDDAGSVVVVPGGRQGLRVTQSIRFSQDSANVPGAAEPGDQFGGSLASGDFDADGFADVAVGASSEDLGSDPETGADAGSVTVFYGSSTGLRTKGAHTLVRPDQELGTSDRQESRFGYRLAAADFDADGDHDLVVASASGLGGVLVYRGRPDGLTGGPAQQLSRGNGLPSSLTTGSPNSLATGDLDDNGVPDLVLGLPETGQARGAVTVVYAAAGRGLDPQGVDAPERQLWTQGSRGVKGTAAPLDAFGAAVGVGDVTGDGVRDLVVGAVQEPTETLGVTGALHVLRGSDSGVTAGGDVYLSHDELVDDPHGALGDQLDVGRLNDNARADIAVTAASMDALGNRWGRVLVLYGHRDGPGAGRTDDFTQATPGVPGGVSATADYWGEVLRIRDVVGSKAADLLVADPRDVVAGEEEVGRVTPLWGSATGLTDRASSLTQNAGGADRGIPGWNEAGDRFGSAL